VQQRHPDQIRTSTPSPEPIDILDRVDHIQTLVTDLDLRSLTSVLAEASPEELTTLLERLPEHQRAVVYRLLAKDVAMEVFDRLSPGMQADLIQALQDREVAEIFADLDPDDRVWLLDELPSTLAPRLLHGLDTRQRQLTSAVLGYRQGSIGRRMSPEYVSARFDATVTQALHRVHARLDDAETVYSLPVLDHGRRVVGIVSLRDLMRADPDTTLEAIMNVASVASAHQDEEDAARQCARSGVLALPIVDKESRLVGVLTVDDALRILEQAESEDSARQGGVEPLRRPYLATPVRKLVSSRIVWLLVLAIGATLTVQVMNVFEDTLAQVTVLALFVPLLIGTGGNTGNQAATTLTRALALGDVRPRDIGRVLVRELAVGVSLGTLLGALGGCITWLLFSAQVGLVIGLTLLAVCSMAAAIGGMMPIIARALHVDPAVFSNPFITTFVDAAGLIVYFLIARAVLGI
jgi:magnesium transporter